jgi:rhodanese-related sulfurtransferase
VRAKADRARGAIPKAIEIALPDLRGRMHAIPTDKPIVVHYAPGGRSSTAASLLRANGLADVSDLTGGFTQWERGTRPTTTAKPRNTATSPRRASATQARRKTTAKR